MTDHTLPEHGDGQDSGGINQSEGDLFGEAVTLFAISAVIVGLLVDPLWGLVAGQVVSGGWVHRMENNRAE